jgi:tRNA A37 threonylcarbamoyladenosine dehydratase
MPKLREKIAIRRAETQEEKVELIKATNDIQFVKDIIESEKVADLTNKSIIELIDAFDLYEHFCMI